MGAQGSKSSSLKITPHDRAILDLKVQRDKIKQYQRRLTTIEEREKATARELLARGDKPRALSALRRGKYQRSLLEKTDGQLRTLEDLVSNIEFSQIQQSVYHGLERGNEVLKEIHKTLNVESVDKLLEETAEAQAQQREIDEMLATRMTAEEEAQVQEEMDALEREHARESGSEDKGEEQVATPALPDAPTTEPVAAAGDAQRKREPERKRERERQAVPA